MNIENFNDLLMAARAQPTPLALCFVGVMLRTLRLSSVRILRPRRCPVP